MSVSTLDSSEPSEAPDSGRHKDIYSLHGKYIIERYLTPKLPKAPWTWSGPVETRVVDSSVPKTVGILGAGVGGLYAAMMLKSLGIPFQILEGSDRVGGRVFTYDKFPEPKGKHDYYDVGAMRFPKIPAMRRLFRLFYSDELNTGEINVKSKLIEYRFDSPNSFLEFNRHRARASEVGTRDVFNFSETGVPKRELAKGYKKVLDRVFGEFTDELKLDLEDGGHEGWDKLMEQDHHSARSYMAVEKGLSMPIIRWCETMDTSTDSYDRAFSEACLDIVAFGDERTEWKCLDGGSEVLTKAMEAYINPSSQDVSPEPAPHADASLEPAPQGDAPKKDAPKKDAPQEEVLLTKKVVTKLRTIGEGPKSIVGIDVYVDKETSPRPYSHVISTIPLPVFRTLDLDDKNLFDIEQWNALRQLSYGPSVKIGIKFKTQWWKHSENLDQKKLDITGGQSFTDRTVRTVVYPSYGLKASSETTVLIASYTWTSDASSIGALTKSDDPDTRERLKNIVLRDLAELHNFDLDKLQKEYDGMFPWAWHNDPLTQGAFAFFGPGQFGNLYTSLTRSCGQGRLHMAGEALSPRHAWIVGALDASWRAVYNIVLSDYKDQKENFEKKWGKDEEWIPSAQFQKAMEELSGGKSKDQSYDLFMVLREV